MAGSGMFSGKDCSTVRNFKEATTLQHGSLQQPMIVAL